MKQQSDNSQPGFKQSAPGQTGGYRCSAPTFRKRSALYFALLLSLAIAAFLGDPGRDRGQAGHKGQGRPSRGSAGGSATLQTTRNLAKAYYEQGKYPESVAEFRKVVASGQALATDHLDLGLALMQANNLDAALGELTTAKQMNPKLTNIDYNLGILYKRELHYPDAERELKQVVAADPDDPAAWFNLGTVYFAERKLNDALEAQQRVVSMGFGRGQNFYVAALFHTFTIQVRLQHQEEAQKILALHQKMKDRVPNISIQNPALEGGKYGVILVPPAPPTIPSNAPPKVTFAEITNRLGIKVSSSADRDPSDPLIQALSSFGPWVAAADYDGDGHPDLYVTLPGGTNHLFHGNADGTFSDITEKAGVAGPAGSVSATWADFDNCGHPDLFVAGLGGVTLYHNNGNGTFSNQTEKAGLKANNGLLSTRAVLFDADFDGNLDLVLTNYMDLHDISGPLSEPVKATLKSFPNPNVPGTQSRFYRNNGDGTFTDITEVAGLGSAKGRMRGAIFADFDNDGYADLLFLRDDGGPLFYINKGEDKFVNRTAEAGETLSKFAAVRAESADFNHDGNFDLALWSQSGYTVLLNQGNARFTAVKGVPEIPSPSGWFSSRGIVADVDGDGFTDLLNLDRQGKWRYIRNRGGRFEESPLSLGPASHLDYFAAAWLSDPGKLNVLGFTQDRQFAAFEKEGPSSRWVEVTLDGYKSNKLGVGVIVELKAGAFYNKVMSTGGPVRVFAGDLKQFDVVRITWPNQVIQNYIDVATSKPMLVRESERLASSCPFLYVWDGKAYRFFTDILGVAPLGELLPDGTIMKPNPEELVRLGDIPQPRDGSYTFQVTDEMREVDYLDRLRLLAVDHPENEEVYANEIYSSTPAPPALYGVRSKRLPVSAVDDRGRDVLPLLLKADGRHPTAFNRNRVLGLADTHSVTLDLGKFSNSDPVALYLNGWVFWTDSNASRALMGNKQLEMVSPYVQVPDSVGKWVTVIPDMGLPSGTSRTMRLDLTGKFLSSDHRVRIVTNFCVYWDQAFFTADDHPISLQTVAALSSAPGMPAEMSASEALQELPLLSADLHYRGFSAVNTDPEHVRPDWFDYQHVMTTAPWNPMAGRYTRYGATTRLINRDDDRLAVMATGDEMTVRFSARDLPPLKSGWRRDLFLAARGYAKDGEPNTAYSRTVDPMPFYSMSNYPYGRSEQPADSARYDEYLREYETRPGYRLIPPLNPQITGE